MDAEIKNLTQLNCVDALPVALMSYDMQAYTMTHPTPHEMLTGRLMPSSTFRGPHKGLQLETDAYTQRADQLPQKLNQPSQAQQPHDAIE